MADYPRLICGIDPGQSGGIALLPAANEALSCTPMTYKMPETEPDVAALLCEFAPWVDRVVLEAVHAYPFDHSSQKCPVCGQGKTTRGAVATFSFAQSYGVLRGILIGLKIPFETVSPMKWTKAIGVTGGAPGTEKKNIHKAKAQELFPHIKVTHAIADALLIAEYGRRQR